MSHTTQKGGFFCFSYDHADSSSVSLHEVCNSRSPKPVNTKVYSRKTPNIFPTAILSWIYCRSINLLRTLALRQRHEAGSIFAIHPKTKILRNLFLSERPGLEVHPGTLEKACTRSDERSGCAPAAPEIRVPTVAAIQTTRCGRRQKGGTRTGDGNDTSRGNLA